MQIGFGWCVHKMNTAVAWCMFPGNGLELLNAGWHQFKEISIYHLLLISLQMYICEEVWLWLGFCFSYLGFFISIKVENLLYTVI